MYPPHHFGGYEQVWQSAVEEMREHGHEVRVLAVEYRHPGADDGPEADVHRELRWYWRDHDFPRLGPVARIRLERHNQAVLRRHLRELEPDVVSFWSMGGMSHSLIEAVRRRGLPMVAFVHDQWLDYGRWFDQWQRLFYGRKRIAAPIAQALTRIPTGVDYAGAGRYVFVSDFVRRRALELPLGLADTAVAHSGIDPEFLKPWPEHSWGWRLLQVGRLHPDKGIEDSVRALLHLPDAATLTFAGTWDERDEDSLGGLVSELGLESRVTMLGHLEHGEVAELYRDYDALLFPVRWDEPWGLVPLEAMGSGCPVIATGRGGSAEYLHDGENCLLVPAEDPPALAAAVDRLAHDPPLRRRMRAGGFDTAPRHTEPIFNAAVERHLTEVARRDPHAADDGPQLSVVIPTYRRHDALARTLDALERQTVPPRSFEVLVVDDPAEDDSGAVAAAVAADRRPFAVRHLHRDGHGVSAARNAGWRAARAPLVMFLGDDILASPRLIEEHLRWHSERGDEHAGVLGHVRWAGEIRTTPFMRWLEHGYQFDYPAIPGEEASWFNFYTANISLPRALLEESGGFDEERFPFLYEDLDLGYRLGERGFRLLFNRAAEAEHLHPTTIEEWRGRMAATATAERAWVEHRPEMPAYFHDRLAEAAKLPPARGTGRRLLRWIPRRTPVLGPLVWGSADAYYRQRLAPAFLEQWERDASEVGPGVPRG